MEGMEVEGTRYAEQKAVKGQTPLEIDMNELKAATQDLLVSVDQLAHRIEPILKPTFPVAEAIPSFPPDEEIPRRSQVGSEINLAVEDVRLVRRQIEKLLERAET